MTETSRASSPRLDALSPLAVLGRGYALVERDDGTLVRSAGEVAVGEALRLRLARGELEARVTARRTDGTS